MDGAEGKLHAVRIDTEATFERLVNESVADPEMRRRIFDNVIYRQITTMLTGSQEFAATLALHDFVASGRFDLVVLDTPPTANALDFLEAPGRIAAAVSSPALNWFARPPQGARRFSFQRLRSGGALLVRRMAKLVGSRFLDDAGAFLVDFQEVLTAFLARAQAVDKLLRGPDVGFLLVLVPEVAAIDEALYFHERLRTRGHRARGLRRQPGARGAGPRRGGGDRGGAARRSGRRRACPPRRSTTRRRGSRRWRARSARWRCRSGASWGASARARPAFRSPRCRCSITTWTTWRSCASWASTSRRSSALLGPQVVDDQARDRGSGQARTALAHTAYQRELSGGGGARRQGKLRGHQGAE